MKYTLFILFIFFISSVVSYSQTYEANVTIPLNDTFLQNLQNVTINGTIDAYTNIFDYNRPVYYIDPNGMILYVLNPMLTFKLVFNISI